MGPYGLVRACGFGVNIFFFFYLIFDFFCKKFLCNYVSIKLKWNPIKLLKKFKKKDNNNNKTDNTLTQCMAIPMDYPKMDYATEV